MTRSYLKHPLFVSPAKWLLLPRGHEPSLYVPGHYDESALSHNPFVLTLQNTAPEAVRTQFPTGNMVRLVVSRAEHPRVEAVLLPVTEMVASDRAIANQTLGFVPTPAPVGQVLKNKSYLLYLVMNGLWRQNLPQEYRYRNQASVVHKTSMDENLPDTIEKDLKRTIESLLPSANQAAGPGLVLRSGPYSVHFDNSTPVVTLPIDTDELHLPYAQNTNLCFHIMSLADYMN